MLFRLYVIPSASVKLILYVMKIYPVLTTIWYPELCKTLLLGFLAYLFSSVSSRAVALVSFIKHKCSYINKPYHHSLNKMLQ